MTECSEVKDLLFRKFDERASDVEGTSLVNAECPACGHKLSKRIEGKLDLDVVDRVKCPECKNTSMRVLGL